jgi:hypothetical protein
MGHSTFTAASRGAKQWSLSLFSMLARSCPRILDFGRGNCYVTMCPPVVDPAWCQSTSFVTNKSMASRDEIDKRAARREGKIIDELDEKETKRDMLQQYPILQGKLETAIANHSKKGEILLKSSEYFFGNRQCVKEEGWFTNFSFSFQSFFREEQEDVKC